LFVWSSAFFTSTWFTSDTISNEGISSAGTEKGIASLQPTPTLGESRQHKRIAFHGSMPIAGSMKRIAVLGRPVYSRASIDRGQLLWRSLESARSARMIPPVWQRAQ